MRAHLPVIQTGVKVFKKWKLAAKKSTWSNSVKLMLVSIMDILRVPGRTLFHALNKMTTTDKSKYTEQSCIDVKVGEVSK